MKQSTLWHVYIALIISIIAIIGFGVLGMDVEVVVLLSVILAVGVIAYLYTK